MEFRLLQKAIWVVKAEGAADVQPTKSSSTSTSPNTDILEERFVIKSKYRINKQDGAIQSQVFPRTWEAATWYARNILFAER